MRAFVLPERPSPTWVIGLLRRALLVTGLLFGFLLAGSALAHAEGKLPHPVPVHGIEHTSGHGTDRGLLPGLPSVPDTITSVTSAPVTTVTKVVAGVTKTVAPVTKVVTALTTDVTTVVVRTTTPILQPAMGMTAPVLRPIIAPVLGPVLGPGSSPTTAQVQSATPDPDPAALAATATAQQISAPTAAPVSMSVVPPQVWPADATVALPVVTLLPASDQHLPLGGDGPNVDVTGASSNCGSGPSGPMSGISRPFSGLSDAWPADIGVRPGAGPPKWCFFDPRHHPS